MDINLLFRAGMKACGRVLNILPKKEIGSPMEYMMDVLKNDTIPSLNIVFPRLFATTFNIDKLIPVADPSEYMEQGATLDISYSYYRVPPELTEGQGIMSIKSCVPVTHTGTGSSHGRLIGEPDILHGRFSARNYGRYSSANLYEAAAYANLNYADRQLAGQFTDSFRYKFYPPNILAILSSYATCNLTLTVTFNLKNDPSLITVEDTAYEEIRKLFILDLKKTIYDEYGIFDNVQTQNGELNAEISKWESAEDRRDELYKELLSTAHFRTSSMRTG